MGGAAFAILAKLGHSQVAQGFVFAVFVYLAALVKAQSIRYFGASLLFIILAFSGIYASILSRGNFVPAYLEAYLESCESPAHLHSMGCSRLSRRLLGICYRPRRQPGRPSALVGEGVARNSRHLARAHLDFLAFAGEGALHSYDTAMPRTNN